ncbi:MAG: DUF1190 domain-containing protein [Gammaproteobacteria bacterium]|nr:DUF1190 domain-containing protein [Gammaproteobacteria bacterium]
MKRSKHINLDLMRKHANPSNQYHKKTVMRSVALGVVATSVAACDGSEEVEVITSTFDCMDDTVLEMGQCKAAYQQALEESERIGPKYRTEEQCESEFNQCQRNQFGSFTPVMVGYLFANSLWDRNSNRYGGSFNPVYRYFRPFSPLHNQLITADGELLGEDDDDVFKLKKKSLKKKKSFMNTVSRGGFGSVASKKSSYSKSSWGG